MAKLTLTAARELQSSFEGRITSSHDSETEFRGNPTVLIPETIDDVECAIRLVQVANRRVFIRSGSRVSDSDVTTPAAAIVSLEAFRDVDVSKHRITVGAAATTGELAKYLDKQDLFLPLDDNPTQSVVSAVLSLGTSPFLRSGSGFGPLRDVVIEAETVPTEGVRAGQAQTLRNKELRDVLVGDRTAVITKLVLDADPAKTNDTDRWMRAWTAIYERKTFTALCDALFRTDATEFPEGVDLSVRVTSGAYSMNIVIIRITGHGDTGAVEGVIEAAIYRAKIEILESKEVDGPGSSVAAWVATGPGEAAQDEVLSRFGSNAAPRQYDTFRRAFFSAVDFAVGVSTRTGRERSPRVRAWAELQLAPDGNVVTRAEISDGHAMAKHSKESRERMAEAIPADEVLPDAPLASMALVRRAPARGALRGVEILAKVMPTDGFELVSSNRAGASKIAGFKGDVLDKSDGPSYFRAILQYAVSSYSKKVVATRMTPKFVAVPVDAADVALAATFATQQGLKVVTRSGGHQYCGMSSGGADTLLIDMRLFKKLEFSAKRVPTQVTVGPGVTLVHASKLMRDNHVVFPHGECPLVNLGGHVQTGGVGHQLRSLGATLDWVSSFKMVTRDPQSSPQTDVYVEREFTRPKPSAGSGSPTDADVFRAVLGGGPSSFGVLTEITFDLAADRDSPNSGGYSYAYPFGQTVQGFGAAMEQFRQWADQQSQGKLPAGIDYFLTVVSGDFPRPPALVVETMAVNKTGLKKIKPVVDAVDKAVPFPSRIAAHLASSLKGAAPLSVIADDGVRKIGTLGLPKSGREFDLPYKKSLHITNVPFTLAFRVDFVQLVIDTHNSSGLKVVFQGVIGGGKFLANSKKQTTHMQRRNALVQLVFDVFYETGHEGDAIACQEKMKGLLQSYSGGADLRMLWGSFEDKDTNGVQLDMSQPATEDLYYDSPSEYSQLQQIKKYTDPMDLFHTSFNVQLPS